MKGIRFVILTLAILLMFFLININKIKLYLNSSVLYYCWAIMLVSNLGFSSSIQYTTRLFGLVISWFFILHFSKEHLYVKKCNQGYLLLIYIAFCMISAIWSVSVLQTFAKSLELFTDLMLIWLLYSHEDKEQFVIKILNISVAVFGILLIITLAGFILWPEYFSNTGIRASRSVLGVRLAAGLLGANKSSALAALCIAWCLLLTYERKWMIIVLFVISAVVMLYSQSRASLAMIPFILLFKLYRSNEKNKLLYFIAVLVGIAIVFMNFETIYEYLLRGQTLEEIQGGTGRLVMWESAASYVEQRPVIGYGFGAGGELVAKDIYGAETMHSAIYETLLGTGIMGLSMLYIQYIYVASKIAHNVHKYGFKNNLIDFFFLLYFLIRSLTSVGIGNWHSPEIMMWYYVMFAVSNGESIQLVFRKQYLRKVECHG